MWSVTFDCASPAAMARFWGPALGYVTPPPPDGFESWEAWARHHGVPDDELDDGAYLADPDGVLPSLSFLRVPEGKVVKNRLHLDLRPDDRDAEVARLESLGAHRVDIGQGEDVTWVVLADPEGNELCVLRAT